MCIHTFWCDLARVPTHDILQTPALLLFPSYSGDLSCLCTFIIASVSVQVFLKHLNVYFLVFAPIFLFIMHRHIKHCAHGICSGAEGRWGRGMGRGVCNGGGEGVNRQHFPLRGGIYRGNGFLMTSQILRYHFYAEFYSFSMLKTISSRSSLTD